jgi:ribosomal protein S18 acetylase RimI-like enzyme
VPDISAADENDLAEILELQKLAFHENAIRYNDHGIPPVTQTLEEFTEEAKCNLILKAVIDGAIVGFVRGRLIGDRCRISRLTVHPAHQGRGIGRVLMRSIEKSFSVRTFELVTGHLDDRNISLYKDLGYSVVEGRIDKVTDNLSYIHMIKHVTVRT